MRDLGSQLNFQITRVWAKNFRSIADVSFELEPLSALVGPNASGKSNLIDVLRFIKDALRFDMEMAISFRNGIQGIARYEAADGDSDIEMGVAATVYSSRSESGYYFVEYGFVIARTKNEGYRIRKEYGRVGKHSDSMLTGFNIEDGRLTAPDFLASGDYWRRPHGDDESDFDTDELTLPILLRLLARIADLGDFEESEHLYAGMSRLHRNLRDMRFYHIFPNTIRRPQGLINASVLNENASNLASVIREINQEYTTSMGRLKDDLGLLMPGISNIDVDLVGRYLVVKLNHDDVGGGSWLDLSMESDGTIRLLALLVALRQPWNLPVIGIEEPELTVHPGALAPLAELLNEASRRSQVIVTTHSPDFIDFLTEYKAVESLRIVELKAGNTTVHPVGANQVKAVKERLFSPGELHRMGELTVVSR